MGRGLEEVAGRRPGGRAKMGFTVAVKEDVKSVGTRGEDAEAEMKAGDWLWPGKQPKGATIRRHCILSRI